MSLCKANCGFYGQDKLNGYCSVCSTNLKAGTVIIDLSRSSDASDHSEASAVKVHELVDTMISTTDSSAVSKKSIDSTPSRSRCTQCSKKVGLLGFECACKGIYCQKCRHAESHQCTYDFSTVGKSLLQKNNPVVMGMKMVRMD